MVDLFQDGKYLKCHLCVFSLRSPALMLLFVSGTSIVLTAQIYLGSLWGLLRELQKDDPTLDPKSMALG